jgi:hypothetical protein
MAPLVIDVIFALEIGGLTSYSAESCKINSTLLNAKVETQITSNRKKKRNNFTMQ